MGGQRFLFLTNIYMNIYAKRERERDKTEMEK